MPEPRADERPPLLARVAPLAYPPSFRERYGPELSALVVDTGTSPRVAADLAVGALRAWLRPVLGVDPAERVRQRRLATVSTVWVCWCATFVATAGLLRALEDPPPPGFDPDHGGWLVVHDVVLTALTVGWVLVLLVGVPIGLVALRRHRSVRRLVAGPVALLVVCAAMAAPLQLYAASHWIAAGYAAADADLPLWWVLLGLTFVLLLGVDAVWGTVALARCAAPGGPGRRSTAPAQRGSRRAGGPDGRRRDAAARRDVRGRAPGGGRHAGPAGGRHGSRAAGRAGGGCDLGRAWGARRLTRRRPAGQPRLRRGGNWVSSPGAPTW